MAVVGPSDGVRGVNTDPLGFYEPVWGRVGRPADDLDAWVLGAGTDGTPLVESKGTGRLHRSTGMRYVAWGPWHPGGPSGGSDEENR